MEWIESIREAVSYIEENITKDLSIKEIADRVNISPFYFQKGFGMLCGYSLSEYIKRRRLTPVSYTHLDVYKRQGINII